ncbi:MAG: hypothetical protein WC667_04965 [Sulfurimonas sp.]
MNNLHEKLPTITEFKDIAKKNKNSGLFTILGHAQNALAKEYGFNDYNAIKPHLKKEGVYNRLSNGVYKISANLIIDKYGILPLNSKGEAIRRAIEPIEQEDIVKAQLYVRLLKPLKNISRQTSSYRIKHQAEEYLREHTTYKENPGGAYVGNGVLIVTMLINGFKMKLASEYPEMQGYEYSSNTYFNISSKQIRDIGNQKNNRF